MRWKRLVSFLKTFYEKDCVFSCVKKNQVDKLTFAFVNLLVFFKFSSFSYEKNISYPLWNDGLFVFFKGMDFENGHLRSLRRQHRLRLPATAA